MAEFSINENELRVADGRFEHLFLLGTDGSDLEIGVRFKSVSVRRWPVSDSLWGQSGRMDPQL